MVRPRVQIIADNARERRTLEAWLPPAAMAEYVELVDHRPDFEITLGTEDQGTTRGAAARPRDNGGGATRPRQVVLFNADRWDGSTAWHTLFREFFETTDVIVLGAQLPVPSPAGDRLHPLLYPSTIEDFLPEEPSRTCDVDLIFLGDYADEEDPSEYPEPLQPGAEVNWRSRYSRAYSVDLLRRALGGHRRLLLERRSFWAFRTGAHWTDIARLIFTYRRDMMRALVGFSPPGKGYNCVRHSDVLGVGALLLTPPIHELVRVPEPEAWAAEQICVLYRLDCADLAEAAERAITSAVGSPERRKAGRAYFERFGTPLARARGVAEVLVRA